MERMKIGKDKMPYIVIKVFYNKEIIKNVLTFLNEDSRAKLKNCFVKTGWKERKKQIKEIIKNYISDFGKHQEKVKYHLNDNNGLTLITNAFNLNKKYLKEFTHIYHKDTHDTIELEKRDYYSYLKVLPKLDFTLTDTAGSHLTLCKALIPYDQDAEKDVDSDDEKSNKKYEMFYNMDDISEDLSKVDFSNKDYLLQRQKLILEKINAEKNKVFYPLEFISNINYWSIILCHGGYFACGFFLRDQMIDHKTDHKYVVRKKAGQRQIVKDKSKKIKSSAGSQIRRENEKKHQENIEYILKLNEEHLNKSDAIFLQAPGFNKNILVGENKPLTSFKKKILNIPFNVQRANYSFMMHVYAKLTNTVLEINNENIKKLIK